MANAKHEEFALKSAIELTGKALEAAGGCNPVADSESAVEFLDAVYRKLLELQEGD